VVRDKDDNPSSRRRNQRREPVARCSSASVVWAELVDPNGYRKVRPGVVVTPTADINSGKPVRVVAITTRLPNPLPDDYDLLPWIGKGRRARA